MELEELKASARTGDRLAAMEIEVKNWANLTRDKVLYRLASLGLKDRAKLVSKLRLTKTATGKTTLEKEEHLYSSIRTSIKKKGGALEGVAFSFARHGIFLERGVGKHRKKGSPAASAAEKKWITPVLPNEIEVLADLLEREYADIAAGTLVIKVPGILDTKITIGQ